MVKEFDKKSKIDYFDLFSLVVKLTTIRLVLSLAVTFNWKTR